MDLLLMALLALAAEAPATRPAARRAPPPPRTAARPLRPPAPPGLSWDEADAVDATIRSLNERQRSRQPPPAGSVVATERQLNSYLNLSAGAQLPRGISGVVLALQPDRLAVRAQLDLDRLKQQIPPGASLGLLAFLGGLVPVELSGRLTSGGGSGRIELESAVVGGISLPAGVLVQLVGLSTRTAARPQGVDLLAPFALPWAAQRLRLEAGRVCLDFPASPPPRGRR